MFSRRDGRFKGAFVNHFPTKGTYVDPQGKAFAVEFRDKKSFSEIAILGDAIFLSKVPMQVRKELISVCLCVFVCVYVHSQGPTNDAKLGQR